MTTTRLGLMGFGRIGRNVFRLLHDRDDLDVVAINDIADPAALTYLLKYDSIYGRFPVDLDYADGTLTYGNKQVAISSVARPEDTTWGSEAVDIVLDTTSKYRTTDTLRGHIDGGARRVILTSSPASPGDIPLLIRGLNDEILENEPPIVALGSNTSNAAAPILRILNEAFGLEKVYMTVVKAMSNSGRLADVPTDSFRTSRAAGENIIPAETNSADLLAQALPELADRINVVALNVPVADGSTVDMVAKTSTATDKDSVNEAVRAAVSDKYAAVTSYVDDPIVSSDVRLDTHSGIFDSLATMVTGGDLVKTIIWFNNGWGYSHRAVEVAGSISAQLNGEQT
jgi:glyceraldehyde 3-phosphate dehydrogenase